MYSTNCHCVPPPLLRVVLAPSLFLILCSYFQFIRWHEPKRQLQRLARDMDKLEIVSTEFMVRGPCGLLDE